MSSVSKGPASEEFEPFDLSKMTAREVAAELVRRSHPISPDAAPSEAALPEALGHSSTPTDPSPVAAAPERAPFGDHVRPGNRIPVGNQEIVEPLPAFLRDAEELARSADWDWPPESAEPGVRDPLDVLSRALQTHLQERQLQQRAAAEEKFARSEPSPDITSSISSSPDWAAEAPSDHLVSSGDYTHESPLIPSSVMTTGPVMEVDTSLPFTTRLSESLDIPVQPSSIGRPVDSALPASLSPGGFTCASTAPSKEAAVAASEIAADELGSDRSEAASRPAIRRIRPSGRATERAKVLARLWLASASAQAGRYAARLHLARKDRVSVADPAVIDDSDPIVPGSMISQSLVPDKADEPRNPVIFQKARAAASRLAAARLPRRRIDWRKIHWEAVAGGMLLGIALTIGPAIYFLMSPGHAPALTVVTPAAQLSSTGSPPASATTPSTTPATDTAETDAATAPAPVADTAALSASQPVLAPAPPAIVPPDPATPDPAALMTAAGETSASNTLAAGTSTTGAATATSTPPDKAPPLKPVTQKVSAKKVKPKPGTVSAHQVTKTAIEQLSPAKR